MRAFYASPLPLTGGRKPVEECFAAAVGSKRPEEEEPSVPQIPEEQSIVNASILNSTRVVGSFASEAAKEVMQSLAANGCGSITTAHIGTDYLQFCGTRAAVFSCWEQGKLQLQCV